MKSEKPQLGFFPPQFNQLMIGTTYKGMKIENGDDVCRYAADCGITGINLPIGMMDVNRMLTDTEFREGEVARYAKLGTPIVSTSSHLEGQLSSVPLAYLPRFIQFAPEEEHAFPRNNIELKAADRIIAGLRLGKLLGTTLHQTFPGGRGVPHHDQWSTLPEQFREYALLHLAIQQEPIIRAAKENGQLICHEIGHIMEGIQSVSDLTLVRSFLPEDLQGSIKWGFDPSHMDKEGDDAAEAADMAMTEDIDAPGHAKSAIFQKTPGGRHRQNGLPFSEQSGKFSVFGTTNAASAKKFGEILWRDHNRNEKGSWGIIEGESMVQPLNPFQGMRIAAENLRLVIDGEEPIPASEIEIELWDGPTFETFAKSDVKISSLLELCLSELETLRAAAKKHGLPLPN